MTNKQLSIGYVFCFLFSCLLLIVSVIGGQGFLSAFADIDNYSDVLDDLRKDSEFNVEDYPTITGDGSLQVIQIAESTDGELLVYVYQPGAPLYGYQAKSINIAREPDNSINLSFENYWLTYLTHTGVFYKYKVDDFEVNSDPARYYNISNILREWDRYLDMGTGNDNTINEVPYAVAQYWTVTGSGETVSYHMTTSEVVVIEEKYVGYVNYSDGTTIKWNSVSTGSTNAHFVAFSTDWQIDKLLCATLTFVEQPVECRYCCNVTHDLLKDSHNYKEFYDFSDLEPIKHTRTITYKEKGQNAGGGNVINHKADPYAWYRIRTTKEFLADENNKDYVLTSEGEDNVENTQWVLSFYETANYLKTNSTDIWQPLNPIGWLFMGEAYAKYSKISEVMILELEFETDGHPFKLGVVDNKQTGGGKPINTPNPEKQQQFIMPLWGWVLIAVGGLAIVLILVCALVPGAAPVIGRIFATIGKVILWVILLPFRLIGALFKAIGNAITRRKATAAATSKPSKGR